MADAPVLGTGTFGHGGSRPLIETCSCRLAAWHRSFKSARRVRLPPGALWSVGVIGYRNGSLNHPTERLSESESRTLRSADEAHLDVYCLGKTVAMGSNPIFSLCRSSTIRMCNPPVTGRQRVRISRLALWKRKHNWYCLRPENGSSERVCRFESYRFRLCPCRLTERPLGHGLSSERSNRSKGTMLV